MAESFHRSQRKLNCTSWKRPLVPCMEEYIIDVTIRKEHLIIRQSTSTKAEAEGSYESHAVDIENHVVVVGSSSYVNFHVYMMLHSLEQNSIIYGTNTWASTNTVIGLHPICSRKLFYLLLFS
ncbi:hypothetical protein KFK09_017153 [Dendrobium nobile]|uniref:Uncharacterized protein n=1 Tax=Dendrobium nobile TaxID=94219 RepID=A0A8T3B081_DENNO|nr:hypothetical protein KFK09_017153 [Dendrobium nobile]